MLGALDNLQESFEVWIKRSEVEPSPLHEDVVHVEDERGMVRAN
jgi:hypothetical protein